MDDGNAMAEKSEELNMECCFSSIEKEQEHIHYSVSCPIFRYGGGRTTGTGPQYREG